MFELSLGWLAVMIDVSLKGLLLAGVTGALLIGGRIRSSSLQHAAWLGVLGALLGLPLLAPVLPAIPVPLPTLPESWLTKSTITEPVAVERPSDPELSNASLPEVRSREPREFDAAILVSDPQPVSMPEASVPSRIEVIPQAPIASLPELTAEVSSEPPSFLAPAVVTWPAVLAMIWMIGAFLLIARLAWSIGLTGRLVQRATPIQSTELLGGTMFSFRGKNQRPVSLRESDIIFVPMTTGWIRPYILLPSAWQSWTAEKLGHVLVHEFAHVRRGDCWTALAAEFVTCVYWFHPLAWWLRRRLSVLAEECCDDAAVAATGDRTGYARHLLEIASLLCGRGRRLHYAGLAMARRTQVERRILAILDGNRPLSQRLTWSATLLIAALILPLVALAAALRPANEPIPEASTAATVDEVVEENVVAVALDTHPPPQDEPANSPAEFLLRGRVTDTEDKSLSGVTVAIRRIDRERWSTGAVRAKLLAEVVTDADGHYEHLIPRDQLPKPTLLHLNRATEWIQIATNSPGHGVEIQNITSYNEDRAFDLKLTPDTAVQGRVLNLEGRPVAGVDVRVLELFQSNAAAITRWHDSATKRQGKTFDDEKRMFGPQGTREIWADSTFNMSANLRVSPSTLATAATDAEGKFELRGLGADRLVVLELSGPNLVRSLVNVVTRPLKPVQDRGFASPLSSGDRTYYGASFDYVISPSAVVQGVVRDIETKRPLAGALITTMKVGSVEPHMQCDGFITATTDAQGHYRFEGLPPGEGNRIKVYPSADEPYLVTHDLAVPTSPNLQPVTFDIELRKGVWATGRVHDVSTNKPVVASLQYTPVWTNPFLKNYPQFSDDNLYWPNEDRVYTTDADGRFRVAVIPGRGILAAKVEGGGYLAGYGREAIPEVASTELDESHEKISDATVDAVRPANYHSLREINPAADAENVDVDLPLDPGVSVKFSFVGPDGQPVRRVGVTSLWSGAIGMTTDSGALISSGLSLSKPTIMLFNVPLDRFRFEDQIGKVQVITPQADGETIVVRLEPYAKVRGRLLDAAGKPWPARFLRHVFKTEPFQINQEFSGGQFDVSGRFEIGLMPGCKYRLTANGQASVNYRNVVIAKDIDPKPGEVIDLGDIKIDPAQPEKDDGSAAKPEQAAQQQPGNTTKLAKASSQESEFSGKVVDTDGRPVAGAEVWVAVSSYRDDDNPADSMLRRVALSDQGGDFSFQLKPVANAELSTVEWTHRMALVAKAPGHGCDWLSLAAFETNPVVSEKRDELEQSTDKALGAGRFATRTLKLPKAVGPVRGRLVDLEGRPLQGVVVLVEEILNPDLALLSEAFAKSSSDIMVNASYARQPLPWGSQLNRRNWQMLIPPIKTNANGEFSLAGLGRDQLATVTISGERVAAERLFILGTEMETKRVPHLSYGAQDVYVGLQFVHAIGPAVPVHGVVTEFQSGKPIAHATVVVERLFGGDDENQLRLSTNYIRAVTDEQGRYQLIGIPPGEKHELKVIPPKSDPWLIAEQAFSIQPDQPAATVDVKVFRGIWMEGRVTDAKTGEPVPGFVDYFALAKNPHTPQKFGLQERQQWERFPIAADGRYRTAGLPGPGVLQVRAYGKTVYPRSVGAETIEGYDAKSESIPTPLSNMGLWYWHLIQFVDPPTGVDSHQIDLTLSAGSEAVVGRVVGPNDEPVSRVEATGQEEKNRNVAMLPGDKFTVHNYDPAIPRNLFFKSADKSLIGFLHLAGTLPADLTVRLQPSITVHGRLMEAETDRPAVGYQLLCESSQHGDFLINDWVTYDRITTDAKGRFEIKGLLAGTVYKMEPITKNRRYGKNRFTIDLTSAKPGAVVELGDVNRADDKSTSKGKADAGQASQMKTVDAGSKVSEVQIHGRVTTENGQLIAGAAVAVVAARVTNDRGHVQETLVEGTTDQAGNYDLTVRDLDPRAFARPMLFVRAAGRAITWQAVDLNLKDSPFDLKLDPEEVIQVRLIDIQGQPAAGVTANYFWVIPTDSKVAPPKLTSDKNGLLTIPYIAAGKGVYLKTVGSEKFAPQSIGLNTGWPETREKNDGTYRGIIKNLKSSEIGTLTLAPARIFEGVVLLGDSGKPAAHAKLEMWASEQDPPGSMMSIDGETDENGRFRLNPYPGVQFGINAYPPAGTPYQIRQLRELRWETGDVVRTLEIRLPAATLAQGTIIDAETGRPLAQASVQYLPNRVRNKSLTPDVVTGWQGMQLTDDAGKFQITVAPGPGTLLVHAPAGTSYVLHEKGGQELNGYLIGGWRHYAHAFQQINPPVPQDDGKSTGPNQTPPLTISLQPGGTVTAKLLDDKGQPIQHAVFTSILQISPTRAQWQAQPQETKNGQVEFQGLAAGRKYPVFVLNVEQKLGARAEISLDDPQPTIVLKPCATAKARFIDAKGKPAKKGNSFGLSMIATPGSPRFTSNPVLRALLAADEDFSDNFHRAGPRPTRGVDANGVEEFLWLVPGATYRIDSQGEIKKEFVAEAGKEHDLGEVVINLNE